MLEALEEINGHTKLTSEDIALLATIIANLDDEDVSLIGILVNRRTDVLMNQPMNYGN